MAYGKMHPGRQNPLKHQLFTRIFAFKLFIVSIAVANSLSSKYYFYCLAYYFYHELHELEQNRTIQTIKHGRSHMSFSRQFVALTYFYQRHDCFIFQKRWHVFNYV